MCTRVVALVVGLASCGPGDDIDHHDGTNLRNLFPFDGVRTWEFTNTEPDVSYKLVGQMRSDEPDLVGDHNVYPVDYTTHCVQSDPACVDGEQIRTVVWASDRIDGVFIHAWMEGNASVDFEPPIMLADVAMQRGDVLTTETAGATWTSTLVGFESCPVRTNVDWEWCARFRLDDGDDDDATGAGLTGEYLAVIGYNVVAMELDGEAGRWELSDHTCEPEESCLTGEW